MNKILNFEKLTSSSCQRRRAAAAARSAGWSTWRLSSFSLLSLSFSASVVIWLGGDYDNEKGSDDITILIINDGGPLAGEMMVSGGDFGDDVVMSW